MLHANENNVNTISSTNAFPQISFPTLQKTAYCHTIVGNLPRKQSAPGVDRSSEQQVHLIGTDGKSLGVCSLKEATSQAETNKLVLYLITPHTHKSPHAVYKLMDRKSLYELKKNKKEKKSNIQKNQTKTKELSFSTEIAGQDFHWKLKKVEEFLLENHKISLIVNQKRWSKSDKKVFFDKLIDGIKEFGEVEGSVSETGRRLKCTVKPVKQLKS